MRLYIIRHGQTDSNAARIVQGHNQTPLNDLGNLQAQKLAQRIANEGINCIYASDLKRARETAKAVADVCKLSLYLTDKLRERSYGVFDGKAFAEYEQAYLGSGQEKHDFRPEGGENFVEVRNRAADFLTLLFSRYANNETIALVAHAGINKMLLSCLLNKSIADAMRIEQKNTCVNIIDVDADGAGHAVVLNCTEHLG